MNLRRSRAMLEGARTATLYWRGVCSLRRSDQYFSFIFSSSQRKNIVSDFRREKMNDRSLQCKDCNKTWVWTIRSQERYKKLGYKRPIRCIPCQKENKAKRGVDMAEFAAELTPPQGSSLTKPNTGSAPLKPLNESLRLTAKSLSGGTKVLVVARDYDEIVSAGMAKFGFRHAEQLSITIGTKTVLTKDNLGQLVQGSEITFAKKS